MHIIKIVLIFFEGPNSKKEQKADGRNKPLELHNSFSQKNLTRAIFLLSPAANMLRTNLFPIGCIKWQHAVILESICETNSIIIFLPAWRMGLRTPLLICSLLLFSFLFGQIIPTPFLPFTLLDKILLSPIPLPSSLRQNYSKSKFPLLFALPGLKN